MIDTNSSIDALTFVSFDFETTGLNPKNDRIVEIGAVRFTMEKELARLQQLVHPGIDIPEGAIRVHGITLDALADAPSIEDAIPALLNFIDGAVLVAHNVLFDLAFLNAVLERNGHPHVSNPTIDTVKLSQKALPNQRSYKLQMLAQALSIAENVNFHRALDDACTCMKLFYYCVERISFIGQLSLKEIL